jgi:hypothetical protein
MMAGRVESRESIRWPSFLVLARRTNLTAESEGALKCGPLEHPPHIS